MSRFRKARPEDIPAILDMMASYYGEDGYSFDREASQAVAAALIRNSALGALWVAAPDGKVVGYLAVTLGFSLEYRGADAFIDELYIAEEARGMGLGGEALRIAEGYCRANKVQALHLEVEQHRDRALELYRNFGFVDHDRFVMTKQIDGR